jgi:GTP-binding protein Era
MQHRAGFVNIIGKPNAGKSTLMNELVGEKLAIITQKAQTTRHRILGIVNEENSQIVFSDTPGILEPHYKLQEAMLHFVLTALEDADVLLILIDITDPDQSALLALKDKIKKSGATLLVLLNKIDLVNQGQLEESVETWAGHFPEAEILPLSALHSANIDILLSKIHAILPEGPPYFEKDQLTDRSERFFASEIIREKILLFYDKEIPYSCEAIITEFKDEPAIIKLRAEIFVNRESQKAILIGSGGSALKRMGTAARKDMEKFFNKKVFLELFVKVSKDWRDTPLQLKRFGYLD